MFRFHVHHYDYSGVFSSPNWSRLYPHITQLRGLVQSASLTVHRKEWLYETSNAKELLGKDWYHTVDIKTC